MLEISNELYVISIDKQIKEVKDQILSYENSIENEKIKFAGLEIERRYFGSDGERLMKIKEEKVKIEEDIIKYTETLENWKTKLRVLEEVKVQYQK